jgi:hypothetical protein
LIFTCDLRHVSSYNYEIFIKLSKPLFLGLQKCRGFDKYIKEEILGKTSEKESSVLLQAMTKLSEEIRKSGKRGSSLKLKRMLEEEKDEINKKQSKKIQKSKVEPTRRSSKLTDLKLKELKAFAGVHEGQITEPESPPKEAVKSPRKTPVKSPRKSPNTTPIKSPRRSPVRSPKIAPIKSPQKPTQSTPRKTPVKSRRSPVRSPKITSMKPTQKPTQSTPRKTPVKSRSPVRSPKIAPIKSPQKPTQSTPRKASMKSQLNITNEETCTLSPIETTSFIVGQGLGILNEYEDYPIENSKETANVSKTRDTQIVN